MIDTSGTWLVVGGDGLVGAALLRCIGQLGRRTISTTRRPRAKVSGEIFLDLSTDLTDWVCPPGISVAFICAGVTRLDPCKRDPAGSRRINVVGVPTVARKLAEAGAFVVALSTNQVYDGSVGYCQPQDRPTPITEYGRQKADAEQALAELGDRVAIVRCTKILEHKPALISGWVRSMLAGTAIQPFTDMVMAPVPLNCVVTVLRLIAERQVAGIWQISGERDMTYAQCAQSGAMKLGLDAGLIRPIPAAESGHFTEALVRSTTLDVGRVRAEFGIVPPDVRWTVEQAFLQAME